jgi:pimeloyl-ACP methyl ester carboxylesterase
VENLKQATDSFQRSTGVRPGNGVARPFCRLAALTAFVLSAGAGFAADWPPTLDASNPTTRTNDGRIIERYTHGPREAWGYPADATSEWAFVPGPETGVAQQNHSCFYVVAPKKPRENAPLCVVLHSANRTAYDYLGFACLGRQIENREDPATVMTNSPDDFYSLYLSSTNAEWWGWSQTREKRMKGINAAPPAELRVLDTIEWVAERCKIDRNRIYLCGVSMGGCGTLGLGLPHGEVFAAVRADVPAGTGYAAYRFGGFAPSPAADAPQAAREAWLKRAAGVGLPDPPVVVDFSSQQDNWAMTQPALVQAAQAGRLPLVLSWGPFGHVTFSSLIAKYPICDVALAYPWLEIRKNEAYPVFTHASCDQQSPWLNAPAEFDSTGQMNAWFRWKNQRDTPTECSMQLWIAHPTVKTPPAMPETATADVTLRRLQQFKVRPGRSYVWELTRDGKVMASGKVDAGEGGLITIPRVGLSTGPTDLVVKSEAAK